MITLRTVTGTFYTPAGDPAADLAVSVRLSPNSYSADGHLLTEPLMIVTTDEDGLFTADLIVGARYKIQAIGQKAFDIIIPADGPATLEVLHATLDSASTPIDAVQTAIAAALSLYTTLVAFNAAIDALEALIDALDTDLVAEALTRATADTAEATARTNADTTLQANITTEATTRASADTTLQNNINAEAATRASADTTLTDALTAETTARSSADTTLTTNLAAEVTNRTNADTALQTDINTRLNQTTGDARYGRLNQIYGPQLTVGAWYHASILASSTTVQTPTLGMLFCIPLLAIRSATWDRVRFEVTVIGSADAVATLGLYAYDATTGRPGSLLATLGSSSNPAVAVHELTVNQAVTPGLYFMALLITGTTAPQIRAAGTPAAGILGTSGMSPAATIGALVQTGQSSLPATPVIAGPATTVPQLGYRIGALS